LSDLYKEKVVVRKSGGDAHHWFLQRGGITGEADFEAVCKNKTEKYEFQYADSGDLDFFDFKVSKVGKKIKGIRTAFQDKKFIYIVKPLNKYAIIEPEWIMRNGKESGVPAWGNRTAYRVPNSVFMEILNTDKKLEQIVKTIDLKTALLNFAYDFIKREENKLSYLLQSVIDTEQIVKFIPKDLDSFYKICFLIDKLNETPVNTNLWLIYVFTFFNEKMTSYQTAQLIYCIDFLYSKTTLQDNEITQVIETLKKIKQYCKTHQKPDGRFETSAEISPKEEARNLLFTLNLLEDLTQDSIVYYNAKLTPIEKIFEDIQNPEKVLEMYIKGHI